MGPKPVGPQSNDLFRQRLDELVNLQHPLARLAQHIDWHVFEEKWAGHFKSSRGRPATPPRLIAGLLYLQHTFALSDEDVVWGWVENPYWQLFCGETWFQHRPPIDPSSLTRWRQRIGEEGLEWMLTQTIKAAESTKTVKPQSFQKIIVDSTVQEKAIAYPTDSKLLERARQHLVKLAAEDGLVLRQNYNREAPRLAGQVGRYAHAKQYKRMRASLKKLKTLVGRVCRDVERKAGKTTKARQERTAALRRSSAVAGRKENHHHAAPMAAHDAALCIEKTGAVSASEDEFMNREIQSIAKKLAELIEEKTGRTCAVVAITGDEDYARQSCDALFDSGVRLLPGHEAKLLNPIR